MTVSRPIPTGSILADTGSKTSARRPPRQLRRPSRRRLPPGPNPSRPSPIRAALPNPNHRPTRAGRPTVRRPTSRVPASRVAHRPPSACRQPIGRRRPGLTIRCPSLLAVPISRPEKHAKPLPEARRPRSEPPFEPCGAGRARAMRRRENKFAEKLRSARKARAISKTQCWLPARAPTAEYPTTNAVDSDQNGPPQWSTSVHIHQYEAAFVDVLPIP